MVKIIDRYIVRQFLLFFLAALVVFTSLFLAVDFMTNLAKYTADVDTFIKYYLLLTLSIVYQLMPIAFLMAAVFSLSTMNRNNELVALFSSGLSLARISAPILITIVAISFVSFFVADLMLPKLDKKKDEIYYNKIKKKPWMISTIRTDKIWFRSQNRLFNLQSLMSAESKAQGLTLYYFDDAWNLLQVIKADDVEMKKGYWRLLDGLITVFEKDSPFPVVRKFSEKTIGVSEEFDVLNASFNSAEMMTTAQLSKFIEKNREAGLNTTEYEVGFHKKISYAFAGLVIVLMSIPFTVGHRRSGGVGKNVGMSMLIAFAYWLFYSSFLSFGKHGVLPPIVAAWTPNLVFFGFAIFLLIRMKK